MTCPLFRPNAISKDPREWCDGYDARPVPQEWLQARKMHGARTCEGSATNCLIPDLLDDIFKNMRS